MSSQINRYSSSTSTLKGRRATRTRCRIAAMMTYLGRPTPGQVVDISTSGMAFDLGGPFNGIRGSKVKIECRELGVLEGTVKWLKQGRIGIEFDASSGAAAQVSAYFRFFHKDARPSLKG
ncbi:MAG: PilZ domain-containing protein [Rhizobiaceae bacterium]|nr:PilZ domain-containing protein [Rhizobiaceae bacterium]